MKPAKATYFVAFLLACLIDLVFCEPISISIGVIVGVGAIGVGLKEGKKVWLFYVGHHSLVNYSQLRIRPLFLEGCLRRACDVANCC